jgi:hypothetical protein
MISLMIASKTEISFLLLLSFNCHVLLLCIVAAYYVTEEGGSQVFFLGNHPFIHMPGF